MEPDLRPVLRSAGFEALEIEPLPEGGSNWLFKLTLNDGHIVVAKTPKHGRGRLDMERALLRETSDGGLLVPRVIDVLDDGHNPPVMISTYLSGATLDEAAKEFDPATLREVAFQIGHTLAKIHSLDVGEGYGNLDATLQGADSFVDWFIGGFESVVDRARAALSDPAAVAGLDRAEDFMKANQALLTDHNAVLLHGDYRPGNLLFEGPVLTGIIDWEAAKRGPAALDFAWWDWATRLSNVPITSEDLIPGYRAFRSIEADPLRMLKRVAMARITIGHLDWALRTRNKEAEEQAGLALRDYWPENDSK